MIGNNANAIRTYLFIFTDAEQLYFVIQIILFIVLAFIVVMVTPMAVNKRQLPECPTDDNTTAPPNMSDNDVVPTSNDDTCYKPKPANA
ncbi:12248_t:CDS:2 [Funneliformis mosseae]|uniref:12248_t:CDS:1 n=1 Tax=Funneliformis mosseae TaxID=27381 RepID=A0A9N9FR37_FUNMO|nr:12248_t:CDS:2 [Funneliformis mosseae]